jgi:hypothetical protein
MKPNNLEALDFILRKIRIQSPITEWGARLFGLDSSSEGILG